MIKAHDVRIGNLLNLKNSGIIKVEVDNIGDIVNNPAIFEPIPLTTEWLERCGFRHRNESEGIDRYFIGTNPVTHDWLFDIVKIDHYNYFFYRNGHFKVSYLHQLQNLYYALTGEEININP